MTHLKGIFSLFYTTHSRRQQQQQPHHHHGFKYLDYVLKEGENRRDQWCHNGDKQTSKEGSSHVNWKMNLLYEIPKKFMSFRGIPLCVQTFSLDSDSVKWYFFLKVVFECVKFDSHRNEFHWELQSIHESVKQQTMPPMQLIVSTYRSKWL